MKCKLKAEYFTNLNFFLFLVNVRSFLSYKGVRYLFHTEHSAFHATSELFDGIVGKSFDKLKLKAWRSLESHEFKIELVSNLSKALAPVLLETVIQRWSDFLDQNVSASRLLQYAISKTVPERDQVVRIGIKTVPPYEERFNLWWKSERLELAQTGRVDQGSCKTTVSSTQLQYA